jgi:anti-sigma regulatory factor (Ser/Thr protein kinase)
VRLQRSAQAVRVARGEAHSWLFSHPGLWAVEDEIAIVVSELVAYVVLHGREPIELTLEDSDGTVRVEVADGNPELPGDRDREGGASLGLLIVERISRRTGAVHRPSDGKTTWAEVSG